MSYLPAPPAPSPYVVQAYVYLPPIHRSSTAHLVCAWLAALLTAGYLLPWAIGATRNRTNCAATALVNLFLGWTLIGWVIALVMACGSEPRQPVVVQTFNPQPYVPTPVPGHPAVPAFAPIPAHPVHPAALPASGSRTSDATAAEVTMPLPAYRPGPGAR